MSSPPMRTCVGCRQRAAGVELLRVVAEVTDTGPELVPDPRRRAQGRGAHLHPDPGCLEAALRRRAFTRALRLAVGPRTERLRNYVEQYEAPPSPVPTGVERDDRVDRQGTGA